MFVSFPFPWKVRLEQLHDLKTEVFDPGVTQGKMLGPLILPHMPDTTHRSGTWWYKFRVLGFFIPRTCTWFITHGDRFRPQDLGLFPVPLPNGL